MSAEETMDQAADEWAGAPLLGIECSLSEIATAERLLRHMATTELEIVGDELNVVGDTIAKAHADIE
jgi:hypothetical protein